MSQRMHDPQRHVIVLVVGTKFTAKLSENTRTSTRESIPGTFDDSLDLLHLLT